jgi:hypothetical protein
MEVRRISKCDECGKYVVGGIQFRCLLTMEIVSVCLDCIIAAQQMLLSEEPCECCTGTLNAHELDCEKGYDQY